MSIVLGGLVLWFDGKNNSGTGAHDSALTAWADLSGNGNHGQINNAAWEDTRLTFDGSGSWVNCGKHNFDCVTVEAIVEFRALTAATGESNSVFGNWQAGGYGIQLKDNCPAMQARIGGKWYHASGSAAVVGSRLHLTGTYDGAELKLYINGKLSCTVAASGTIDAPANATVASIGSNPYGTEIGITPLNGYIYAARLYDRALTQGEVWQNYAHDAGYVENNLLPAAYRDLNNWTKNMPSYPVFSCACADGVNTVTYQGGGDFERIYLPVDVEPYTDYHFRFQFHSPTGFSIGTYGADIAFAFACAAEPSDTTAALSRTLLGRSDGWATQAADSPTLYSFGFNSGALTKIYLAFDFGYILDGETATYVFSNLCLDNGKAPILSKYLLRVSGVLYTITDGALAALEATTPTAQVFQEYGLDVMPTWEEISSLADPEILLWHETQETPKLSATITTGVPPQEMTCTVDMSHESITGIFLLSADYGGTVLLSHRVAGGEWTEPVTLGEWIAQDCAALYQSLGDEKLLYLKFILHNGATLTRFKITFQN